MSKVVFIFEGSRIEILCSEEEKMKDICKQLANKIDKNINNIHFLFNGDTINLELKYKEIKKSNNEVNILVYEKENEGMICPKCGETINIYNNNNNNVNEYIKNELIEIKDDIEIINNSNNMTIDRIKNQLKNIMKLIDNMLQQIKKNEIINNNKIKKIENIITGIIDIQLNDINRDIILYESNEQIDVYFNNQKIDQIKKDNNKYIYKFNKEGKYDIKYQFKNNITDLRCFFEYCKELIYLDLSNFNTSEVTNMSYMFFECNKLKEIKGINQFNTNNVTNMKQMFGKCYELISLDLSNFNTSKVTNMSYMFFECNKLK